MLRARFPDSIHSPKRKATTGIERINPTRREIGTFGKTTVEEHARLRTEWNAWKALQKEPASLDFVLHDFRRTVRTRLAELRVPSDVAEYVIGHKPRGIVAIYNQHAYLLEMREAWISGRACSTILFNHPY